MARTSSPPLSVEFVLLGFLAQRPCHGYELHKQLLELEKSGLEWNIKQGNLYALLERMRKKGWVEAVARNGGSNPPKNEFSLTLTGRQSFENWVHSPVHRAKDFQPDFMARLFFARQNGDEEARLLLDKQARVCQQWLIGLHLQHAGLENQPAEARAVCEYRIRQVEAVQAWLEWACQNGV